MTHKREVSDILDISQRLTKGTHASQAKGCSDFLATMKRGIVIKKYEIAPDF